MSTAELTDRLAMINLPGFGKVGDMVSATGRVVVLCFAIVMSGLVLLGVLGALVFLIYSGRSTDAVSNLFNAAQLGAVIYAIAEIRGVKANTNGVQAKLIDAAIASPAAGGK